MSLVGAIAEKLSDAILPDELEFVGDLVGGAVDIYVGDYIGAAEHAVDLVKDMPSTGEVIGNPTPDPPTQGTSPGTENAGTASVTPAGGSGTSIGTLAEIASNSGVSMVALSPTDFFGLSDKDFMKAIRDGAIPKEVLDDKGAMIRLQERMNRISEMNQLITQVTQAMHQMSMSVINNCRV